MMSLLRSQAFWKYLFWGGVALFFLARLFTLMSFPIFNDEAIYIQYSQLIHQDFGQFKFVAQGLYGHWKPPLQYWLGSLVVGIGTNPLLAVRVLCLFVSLGGLFGIYLFVKELWGKKEAAVAACLYALSPAIIFYNNQFVAETFVFSAAPFMFWAFLKAVQPDRIRFFYAFLGLVFAIAILLFKQTGIVYLILGLLVPFLNLNLPKTKQQGGNNEKGTHRQRAKAPRRRMEALALRLAVLCAVILLAVLVAHLFEPSGRAELKKAFSEKYTMSAGEILGLPFDVWVSNVSRVFDFFLKYQSVFIFPLLLFFFIAAVRRRTLRDLIVGLMFLGASAAVMLLLKAFGEYVYNGATVPFLIPILARAVVVAIEMVREPALAYAAASGIVIVSTVLMLGHWGYQITLMQRSPDRYLERGTSWMKGNYLKGWPGGFGVAEVVEYLEKQEGPGVVIADGQWGNPRTSLEVFNSRYPKLRILGVSGDFYDESKTLALKKLIDAQPFKTRLAVFSADTDAIRAPWQNNIQKFMCAERQEVSVVPGQTPIIICKF